MTDKGAKSGYTFFHCMRDAMRFQEGNPDEQALFVWVKASRARPS